MSHAELSPGLMVLHGNRAEALRDVLVTWMRRHPLAPLENEVILVQSNGIAQWLRLALAEDPADGGCGIAAALDMSLPSRFLWQVYRAVLGTDAVPQSSVFDKPLLIWRLMRLLPDLLDDPIYAPLRRFLRDDDDLRKRHQLAERLADLFDQYQVYRADWLADWSVGEDVLRDRRGERRSLPEVQRWQPALWRALLADVGEAERDTSRAAIHARFLEHVAAHGDGPRPPALPRRVMVFGLSALPQQALEVLAAIARWSQVMLCVHNPCEHYWADIVADRDWLRRELARQARKPGMPLHVPEESLHLHAHPLLAAWGKQGRDFIALLDNHDDAAERAQHAQALEAAALRIDHFQTPGEATLLQQLQDDIRDLRPLAETRERWPAVAVARDHSIRFHLAHSAQREVEVLHDALLAAFDADPALRPRDVIVMVPDIDAYAPHIQAVFGLYERDEPRHIPFSIADRGPRAHDPLLAAVEMLLQLPRARLSVSDVLDLVEVPAVRSRFGIAEQDVALLHRWVREANVRWGLNAEHRASFGLPDMGNQNAWDFGLRRMLLGYAAGEGAAWQGIEPYGEVGGLDAALLGPLVTLIDRLEQAWRTLCVPTAPAAWAEYLRELFGDFFAAETPQDARTLQRLETELENWLNACDTAALDEALPLSVVREHLLAALDEGGLAQRFFAGAVTFATLMPMRAIPFRRVCLLGMNDGEYPRRREPVDFDLMAEDYRPGDRSRREDDRYLFLEALLSAREHLHVSWVGRSVHDNSPRPPSVLVAQLREHIARGWTLAGNSNEKALLQALTVTHRLQPFSPDYFPPDGTESVLFSYAQEWRAGLSGAARGELADDNRALPMMPSDAPLTLSELGRFLQRPVESFFNRRLGVFFDAPEVLAEEHEPFTLDGLQRWQLQDELIRAQQKAVLEGRSREEVLEQALARIERRGSLTPGAFAPLVREALAHPMRAMFDRYEAALMRAVFAREPVKVERVEVFDGLEMQVHDWLHDVYAAEDGTLLRIELDSRDLLRNSSYRYDHLLRPFVRHVAAQLATGQAVRSIVVGKKTTVELLGLSADRAAAYIRALLHAWVQGHARPLALAPETGFVWLQAQQARGKAAAPEARKKYEGDPHTDGELQCSAYLQHAWPDFDRLAADGEFAHLASTLLQPVLDAIVRGESK